MHRDESTPVQQNRHCKDHPQRSPLQEWTSPIGMVFYTIPPGSFIMGDNELDDADPHEVHITRPFQVGKYPVTQEEWLSVMGENPSSIQGQCQPVNNVSWTQCMEFIERLNLRADENGSTYRLPTEAEWEYACRANSRDKFFFGNVVSDLARFGWYQDNSHERTHPVGQLEPNPWGLHDLYGNVSEWCQDVYQVYPLSRNHDPTGPNKSKGERVNRGGCWASHAARCASAFRMCDDPDEPGPYLGLRLVREIPP